MLDGYSGRVTVRSECGDGSMEIVRKLFPNSQEPHDVGVVGRTHYRSAELQSNVKDAQPPQCWGTAKETWLSSGHVDMGK